MDVAALDLRGLRREELSEPQLLSGRQMRMTSPSDTVSPTLIRTAQTVPAAGAGTSIVALSASSVISGSSAATVSPGCHMDLDDGYIVEVADVGDLDLEPVVDTARRAVPGGFAAGGFGVLVDALLAGYSDRPGRLHQDHHVALRDAVADRNPDIGDRPGHRRRHVHRRLVRLQGKDGIVRGYHVAQWSRGSRSRGRRVKSPMSQWEPTVRVMG